MITKIMELNLALDFISKVYTDTICDEDSAQGQKNFYESYVYGATTKREFMTGREEYYGYWRKELCGVISLNITGYIRFFFVAKAYQGQGIGHKLLSFAEELARSRGVDKLFLDSSLTAVWFYEKHGFSVISEAIQEEDIWFVPMEKRLR